jgi:AAA+ ATPase superfamily predicted ATPase
VQDNQSEGFMQNAPFVGRENELRALNDLLERKTASLVVMRGRRRIGKSRLITEFSKGMKFYAFAGLAPKKNVTAQMQRDEFAKQLSMQTRAPDVQANDWTDLFFLMSKETTHGRVIVLLDEISWMGSKDVNFLGKLKNAWELYLKKNPKLILILCGSVSSWIEKNILSSTGFFGRIAYKLTLEELPLKDCNHLLESLGFKRSPLEKFLVLALSGGVPWYVELIKSTYSAAENVKKLCFEQDGILVEEFKYIFNDLFGRRKNICGKIVECLSQGAKETSEIMKDLNYTKSGSLSEYLEDLILAGFVSRDYTWAIKSGEDLRSSRFRLRDNYLRFYLKYIAPKLTKIQRNQFKTHTLSSQPNWEPIMGLQFENIVLNNRLAIWERLNIKPDEIISDNPFFQKRNLKQLGCQIDYLIQTKFQTLFVCEIKFSMHKIGNGIVEEMRSKLAKIYLPKGFTCLPVLIHVNGVTGDVENANYFYKIVDFSDLL